MSAQPVVALGSVGPVIYSTDVDLALIAKLKQWLPTYLRHSPGDRLPPTKVLPMPRSYTNTIEGFEFLDNQFPAIIVTTSRATATIGGSNTFYAVAWRTLISCVLRGRRPPETRRLASMFAGAMILAVVQKGRDDTVCNHIRYESLDPGVVVPDVTGQGRYLCQSTATFTVHTDVAVQGTGGPAEPDADTYIGVATVTEVDIEVAGETVSIPPGGSSP